MKFTHRRRECAALIPAIAFICFWVFCVLASAFAVLAIPLAVIVMGGRYMGWW